MSWEDILKLDRNKMERLAERDAKRTEELLSEKNIGKIFRSTKRDNPTKFRLVKVFRKKGFDSKRLKGLHYVIAMVGGKKDGDSQEFYADSNFATKFELDE